MSPATASSRATRSRPPASAAHPRPLAWLALVAAVVAAVSPLVVCAAVGVLGWYLSDSGIHGTPSDGMRTGALAWLAGHASTVTIQGTVVSMLPLGITAACAWTVWRVALRLGRSLAGHGPDADRISDGERDLTVPAAVLIFGLGYGGVLWAVASGASSVTDVSTGRLVGAVVVGCLALVLPAVAVGSGRAAIWVGRAPIGVAITLAATRRLLRWFVLACTVLVVGSLLVHWQTVANTLSDLHSSTGEAVLLIGLSLLLFPNAVAFASAWLLGAGFAVGTGTFVSPGVVILGPLPIFPLVAALPTSTPGEWASWLVVLPGLVAAAAVARTQWLYPCVDWLTGPVRGACAGALAALAAACVAALASGAVGPGRMREIGPDFGAVLQHGLVSFGVGGLIAGLVMTAYQRRTLLED